MISTSLLIGNERLPILGIDLDVLAKNWPLVKLIKQTQMINKKIDNLFIFDLLFWIEPKLKPNLEPKFDASLFE